MKKSLLITLTLLVLPLSMSVKAVELGGGTLLGTWNKAGQQSFAFGPSATVVLGTFQGQNTRWISTLMGLYSNPEGKGDVEAIALTEGVQWWKQVGSLRFHTQFEIGPIYEVDVQGDSVITIAGDETYTITTTGANATRFLALAELGVSIHKFLAISLNAGYVPYNGAHDAMFYGGKLSLLKPL